jgi:hypothetical protein
MPPTSTVVEIERLQFKALALANPNYFGTFKGSPFPVVKAIAQNTSYEDLTCVGFQPQLGQIEAVVRIARNAGYSGPLCSGGSREYVRFYLSFDAGASWEDQGMAQFAAYDTPGPRPLDYAVTRPVNPPRKFCFIENLIKVRAILSWNAAPTPNTPDFTPVWGRVLEADIQVEPKKLFLVKELVEAAKIKLPPEFVPVVNLDQELPVAAAAELTLEQKVAAAKEARVPEHRFLFDTIQPYLAGGAAEAMLAGALPAQLKQLKIDLAKVIEVLIKTDGDTSFEELTCIGYDPGNDALAGVIHVKKPAGYSGKLCSAGSREYVAFWIDWGAGWQYAGTSSVQVHDVAGLPGGGLRYAVFEAVDVSKHRKACQDGPVTAKVRAILSWQTPPPPANPNWVPTWGNREEAVVQLGPGAVTDYQPIFESISTVPVCGINQATGRTSGAYDQPFGGVLTITGLIPNAPDLSTPDAQKLRYRVQVRQWPGGTWQTVDNSFGISVIERIGAALPTQYSILQDIQPDGYYIYREDMNVSGAGWRLVQNRELAKWITATPMTGLYEIRLETKDPATGITYNALALVCADGTTRTTVKVRLDEVPPACGISITGFQRGGGPVQPAAVCGTFLVGDVIHGTYSVSDEHFGGLSLWVEPVAPAGGAAPSPSGRAYPVVPTTGEAGTWTLDTSPMKPCGYIVKLWTNDRTIVSSDGSGWKGTDSVGFCLKK